jgi:hypothetical protein
MQPTVYRLPVRPIFYRLDETNTVQPLSERAALEYFSRGNQLLRRLLATHLQDDSAKLMLVSTVFMGVDMSCDRQTLVLFETMILGGRLNGSCWRYATFEQAINGHAQIVSTIASEWLQLRLPLLPQKELTL